MKYMLAIEFDSEYKFVTKIDGTKFECNETIQPLGMSKKRAEILKNDFQNAGYNVKIIER